MGKAQRDKGKRWEREVAHCLRALYGPCVRRGWQSRMGDDEADITGVPFWWVEAKHHKRVNYRAALRQAVSDSEGKELRPLVVAKDDRQPPVVMLLWDDWLWLQQLLMDCDVTGGRDATDEGSS